MNPKGNRKEEEPFPEKAISVHQSRRQSVSSPPLGPPALNREVLSKKVARREVRDCGVSAFSLIRMVLRKIGSIVSGSTS